MPDTSQQNQTGRIGGKLNDLIPFLYDLWQKGYFHGQVQPGSPQHMQAAPIVRDVLIYGGAVLLVVIGVIAILR